MVRCNEQNSAANKCKFGELVEVASYYQLGTSTLLASQLKREITLGAVNKHFIKHLYRICFPSQQQFCQ